MTGIYDFSFASKNPTHSSSLQVLPAPFPQTNYTFFGNIIGNVDIK
jgi:hypothetical protein